MRAVRLALLAFTLAACAKPGPRPDAGAVRAPDPPCVRASLTWYVPAADAGELDLPVIEGGALVVRPDGTALVAWADARRRRAVLALAPGREAAADLGAGEYTAPVVALAGATPVAAWVRHGAGGRSHVVAAGERLATRCEQPEVTDDGMSVAVAGLAGPSPAALVAWDEERAGGAAVRVQRVALAGEAGACAAPRDLSPRGQDAADPVLVALPAGAGGGAAAFWLASRDVEATVANDTATDVWGVALDAAGAPRGAPLRITATPAHRFGLAAAAAGDAVWLAFRVADESDTEARGDGGAVAVVRVERGLARAGAVAVVTAPGANPTGAPVVLPRGAGAEVWWRDRRSEGVVATRRAVGPAGLGEARDEPAFGGELPAAARGEALAALVRGARGEPGVARYRCPRR